MEPSSPGSLLRSSHREEWLAALSHELRSPLATIAFALESLTIDNSGTHWQRVVQVVERQTHRALHLIDEVFDMFAENRQQPELQLTRIDLQRLVTRAIESTAHIVADLEHTLTISFPEERIFLRGDALRLEQVLVNLLTNSAKFTAPGGCIRIVGGVDGDEVFIRVQDNGRGIEPELIPRIFEPFVQLSDTRGPRSAGLGLGLALVKSLVEQHGGHVQANSAGPGRGAMFELRLPAV